MLKPCLRVVNWCRVPKNRQKMAFLVLNLGFWDRNRQKKSKIWNISNCTPLLQKTLCAFIELYVRNILKLNWGGNIYFYRSVFFLTYLDIFKKCSLLCLKSWRYIRRSTNPLACLSVGQGNGGGQGVPA